MDLKQTIRNIPDFPKEGILFRDITTLLKDADAYEQLISELADSLKAYDVDIVIGPEARGFVIGSALAYAIHAGFVVARKPGKLVVISDNPKYETWEETTESEAVSIIGRVHYALKHVD